jgi:hypothetical protein
VKEFLFYDQTTRITTALKFEELTPSGVYLISVGRSYCSSKETNFSKKIGRTIALKRLRSYARRQTSVVTSYCSNRSKYNNSNIEWPNGTRHYDYGDATQVLSHGEWAQFESFVIPSITKWLTTEANKPMRPLDGKVNSYIERVLDVV